MNHKNIEKAISRAIIQAPAPDFETIVNLPYRRMEEHDFITRQEEKQVVRPVSRYVATFSLCFVLLLFMAGGWAYQYRMPSSRISLDVNPSIEIVTNRQEQVLKVNALNKDARRVLEDQNYRLEELDTAVASIVTEVIHKGYLNTGRNVIMVSVEDRNQEKAKELAASLNQVIKKSVSASEIKPKILSQTLKKDKAASKEAKKLEVSVGKLKLLQKIETANESLTVESLAHKSMTELLSIAEENKVDLKDTIQMEEASDDNPTITPAQEDQDSKEDASDGEENIKKDNDRKDQENTLKEDRQGDDENQDGNKNKIKNKDKEKDREKDRDSGKKVKKDKAVKKNQDKNKENNGKNKGKDKGNKEIKHGKDNKSDQGKSDEKTEESASDLASKDSDSDSGFTDQVISEPEEEQENQDFEPTENKDEDNSDSQIDSRAGDNFPEKDDENSGENEDQN